MSAESNGFESRVFTETVAISDKPSEGLLIYGNEESPEYGIIRPSDYKSEKGFNALKVKISTLDEIYPNLQNINLLRISKKKNVVNAINGAQKIIKRSPEIKIVLDYEKDELQTSEFMSSISEFGFKIYAINEDGEIYPADLNKMVGGYILLKRD